MYQLSAIAVVLCIPFYALNASNVDSISPNEETTDPMMIDVYAPSSDETFDPQKDYADFKTSYEKLYKISGSPYVMPSMQQQLPHTKSMQDFQLATAIDDMHIDATDDTTDADDLDSNANDIQTTITPPIEQQTTVQLLAENVGMRSINDNILKSTQRPIPYASFKQFSSNGEFVKQMPNPTIDHMRNNNNNNGNGNEDDSMNDMNGEPIDQDMADNLPNEVTIRNDTSDYMNDEADANFTQPITVKIYPLETTVAAVPIFVSARTPLNTLLVSTPTSLAADGVAGVAAPTSATDEMASNPTTAKKSKKIEALPRIYKYSADEIVRKYLDDTYLRAPVATLINTAPEPLRKTKILWKSALRPNTAINIVLVAFNSSGKFYTNGKGQMPNQ